MKDAAKILAADNTPIEADEDSDTMADNAVRSLSLVLLVSVSNSPSSSDQAAST